MMGPSTNPVARGLTVTLLAIGVFVGLAVAVELSTTNIPTRVLIVVLATIGLGGAIGTLVAWRVTRRITMGGDAAHNQNDASRHVQAQLAEERSRLQFIFDSLPIGISFTHEKAGVGVSRIINDAHLRICGLTRAEVDDPENFRRITHPKDYETQEALLRRVAAGEINQFSVEKRYLRPDGAVVWVVFSVQRRRCEDGGFDQLSTVVDVTSLKHAQEEMSRQAARLQFIFDSVPIGISLTHETSQGTASRMINEAHLQICGLTREQADEPGIFLRISDPTEYARQLELTRQVEAGEIDQLSLEKRYLRLDGTTRWVVFSLRRRLYDDGSFSRLSTVVDVTALKQAEVEAAQAQARFQLIFDAAPVGLAWMLPSDITTRIVNPHYGDISGVPSDRTHELGLYRAATHPDDRNRQDELHRRLVSGEIEQYQLEKRYLKPDGSVRWALLTVRHLKTSHDSPAQEISVLIDITERKRAEAELETLHKQMLETSRAAGMAIVATSVLHNVGNVLNSVNISAGILLNQARRTKIPNLKKVLLLLKEHDGDRLPEFLTKDPRGQKVPTYLNALVEVLLTENEKTLVEAAALQKHVDHIKQIVNMQQEHATTSGLTEVVGIAEIVEDAIRINAGALTRHGIRIVREFETNPTMNIERHRVLEILVNLLQNAKRACSHSGRAEKQIAIRIAEQDGAVSITVTDNGVGISPENLPRIFNQGFSTWSDGHGFGLHSGAIAARKLGGALTATSEGLDRGASLTLTLPLSQVSGAVATTVG